MSAAVYRMYDAEGTLLYVGFSAAFATRLSVHAASTPWWRDVRSVTVEHFATSEEAMREEGRAQAEEDPIHNVVRDGRIRHDRAKRLEAQSAREAEEADRRARGVYRAWISCKNCLLHGYTELASGLPRAEQPCPRCGVVLGYPPEQQGGGMRVYHCVGYLNNPGGVCCKDLPQGEVVSKTGTHKFTPAPVTEEDVRRIVREEVKRAIREAAA